MRAKYIAIGVVVGVLLSSAVVVLAGNLNPPSGPTDAASQMYSLEQVYQRLDTGAADTKMTTFTEPASGPGTGTMHTLDDVMGIAPAADNTDGALPAEVLAGKTFWSLRTNSAWGTQSGTYPPAPVPRTGATETNPAKGVVWPNPRFTVHDNGTPQPTDDTVTDNLTGLMWTRNADHGQKKWEEEPFYPAHIYCNNLTLGGHDDWRLPNVRELLSLVHYGFSYPAVPNTEGTGQWSEEDPFIGIQSKVYWSGTTYAFNTGYAWGMVLDGGSMDSFRKTGPSLYVWPVRGGQ